MRSHSLHIVVCRLEIRLHVIYGDSRMVLPIIFVKSLFIENWSFVVIIHRLQDEEKKIKEKPFKIGQLLQKT